MKQDHYISIWSALVSDNNMKSKVLQNAEAIMDCEFDDEDDMYHDVCAICDNGGDLTYCDGKCLRAFHATVESARCAKSYCTSLNLPAEEVEGSRQFVCLNCFHEQHQCFVCKELGSSNISSGAVVFCCSLATCGHFYHPKCVAQLLKDKNESEARELAESIADGEPFTCPAHKCHRCQREENEKVEGLQFAICRRCPESYHRKCLPKNILFDSEDSDDVIRAWDDLLPKSRALIFCSKHKMNKKLHTAKRNIKFPEIGLTKKNERFVDSDYTSDDERKVKKPSSRERTRTSSQSEPMTKRFKKNLSVDMKSDSKTDHILVDEDCKLNCDVSVGTTEKVAVGMISQNETPQQSDFEITPTNYNSHCDSGLSSKHFTLDPSTDTRPSISVVQQYAPKLDELNPTVMNDTRSWAYRNLSAFDPGPYRPSEHLNSSAGWLDE